MRMATDQDDRQELRDRALAHWQSLSDNWRRRARWNKTTSKFFAYGSVILTVVTTATAGIPAVPRVWVIVASAGAALAAGLMNATRSHEQWTLAREVQNRLYAERFLFEQGAGAYAGLADDERTRLFSVRITEIGMAGHGSWAGHVSEAATAVVTAERGVSPRGSGSAGQAS